MMELELKAVVAEPDVVRRRITATGARAKFAGKMTDIRYDRGLELRSIDQVLRLRTFHHADGREEAILTWKGPTLRSADGYKQRDEIELPVQSVAGDSARFLVSLGYRPVSAIERDVEIYRLGDATVRLETYPRMDVLLEVEGEPEAIEQAIVASGIPRGEFTAEPLAEFVRRYQERTGRPALVATSQPAEASAG